MDLMNTNSGASSDFNWNREVKKITGTISIKAGVDETQERSITMPVNAEVVEFTISNSIPETNGSSHFMLMIGTDEKPRKINVTTNSNNISKRSAYFTIATKIIGVANSNVNSSIDGQVITINSNIISFSKPSLIYCGYNLLKGVKETNSFWIYGDDRFMGCIESCPIKCKSFKIEVKSYSDTQVSSDLKYTLYYMD